MISPKITFPNSREVYSIAHTDQETIPRKKKSSGYAEKAGRNFQGKSESFETFPEVVGRHFQGKSAGFRGNLERALEKIMKLQEKLQKS